MRDEIKETLFEPIEIDIRVRELGQLISRDYKNHYPLVVGILKGSFIFVADLIRNISERCQVDFMAVSSYGSGTKTTGKIKITKDLSVPIEGRDVILVDDILDSGNTISCIREMLRVRNPASIRIAVLLDKPSRREVPISADYVGFAIPDKFVVGYGLDYDDKYRNLRGIKVLRPEVYNK